MAPEDVMPCPFCSKKRTIALYRVNDPNGGKHQIKMVRCNACGVNATFKVWQSRPQDMHQRRKINSLQERVDSLNMSNHLLKGRIEILDKSIRNYLSGDDNE